MELVLKGLSPLQIQLLIFVKLGLGTPYDLITQAGLSVGLTSPALKRLEEFNLVESTPGSRKSNRYAITKKGEQQLKEAIEVAGPLSFLVERFGTFDSASRAAVLAWATYGRKEAAECVEFARGELNFQSQQKQSEAEQLRAAVLRLKEAPADLFEDDSESRRGILMATAYRWLKAHADANLLKMQSEAVTSILPLLEQLPAFPPLFPPKGKPSPRRSSK
jgi:DNA-binding MarR family transcriptional regulator